MKKEALGIVENEQLFYMFFKYIENRSINLKER